MRRPWGLWAKLEERFGVSTDLICFFQGDEIESTPTKQSLLVLRGIVGMLNTRTSKFQSLIRVIRVWIQRWRDDLGELGGLGMS